MSSGVPARPSGICATRRAEVVGDEAAARDGAGRDGVDPDAVGRQHARQLLHHHGHAGLRGAVVRQVPGHLAMLRGDQQDAALDPVVAHVPAGLAGQEEAGAQVDVGHGVPRRLRLTDSGVSTSRRRGLAAWTNSEIVPSSGQRAVEQAFPAVALAKVGGQEVDAVLGRRRDDVAAQHRGAFGP